jgi:hypothetical protein
MAGPVQKLDQLLPWARVCQQALVNRTEASLYNRRLLRPDTEEAIEQKEATPGGGRGGKGLTQGKQPTGGRGSDTEPSCHVDPNDGCTSSDERIKHCHRQTYDPREEEILCRRGGGTVSVLTGALVSSARRDLRGGALSNERPPRVTFAGHSVTLAVTLGISL